jgi:hypothetical protein
LGRLSIASTAPRPSAHAPIQAAGDVSTGVAPAPVAFALRGTVLGPSAAVLGNNGSGLIANNGGGLIAHNGGGLIANNGGGYRVLGAQSPMVPVVGARVSLVDARGQVLSTEAVVTDAQGAYAFKAFGTARGLVFVKVDYEREARSLTLYAPVRLPEGKESAAVDIGPASTLVAKKILAAAQRGVDVDALEPEALEKSVLLLASAMADLAVVQAVLLPAEEVGRLLDAMQKASPALSQALETAWSDAGGPALIEPPLRRSSHTTAPTLSSLWNNATLPVNSAALDSMVAAPAIELGVKLRAKVDGEITGLRFYKDVGNTGPHTANLWTLDGTLLATTPFTSESASGWQTVKFPQPVPITSNTTYIASYFTTNGNYSFDNHYFTATGVDTTTLQAPAASVVEGNAVYAYNATSTFPNVSPPDDRNYWVDVVFSSLPTPASASSIWPNSSAPGFSSWNDVNPVAVGVKFRADAVGQVSGLKFYKGAGNDGTHVGSLWAADGTRLATANFTGETASRWQSVSFPQPVAIAPNTTYVASYYAPQGHYAADQYSFKGLGRRNGPLVALADGTDGPNGVFANDGMTFPDLDNGKQTNYWVDVVYARATPPSPPASVSLWNMAAAPPDGQDDINDPPTDDELGVRFSPKANGRITGVRFYKSAANTGVHTAYLWDPAAPGTPLATATFTGETASGWQEASFATPVDVTAGTEYVASYTCPVGHFAFSRQYFRTPMDTGSLRVPASGGVYDNTPGTCPQNVNQDTNYWVEPVFSP